jgi:hypothetical protein
MGDRSRDERMALSALQACTHRRPSIAALLAIEHRPSHQQRGLPAVDDDDVDDVAVLFWQSVGVAIEPNGRV